MIGYYRSHGESASLVISRISDEALGRVKDVDRRVNVIDARGWFDVELRATWPQWRYLEGLPLKNAIDWERGY